MTRTTEPSRAAPEDRGVIRSSLVLVVVCLVVGCSPAFAEGIPLLAPPVDGQITRRFEPPRMDWGPGHRGVDYSVTSGTQIRAAAAGTVVFAGDVAGIKAVTIEHSGGLATTYSQMAEVMVEAGTLVGAATWLGTAGGAHSGLGAGLHFGVKMNGEYVDPEDYLGPVDASGAIHLTRLVYSLPKDSLAAEYLPRLPGDPTRPCAPAGELSDDPPAPDDNIAVAIAGIASSTRGGANDDVFSVPGALGYDPDDVYLFSYRGSDGPRLHEPYGPEDTWGDIRVYADRLGRLLRRVRALHPGRGIDLIAHSQGGIVARYLLARGADAWDGSMPTIENLLTFSSPHRGAPLGAVAGDLESSRLGRIALGAGAWLAETGKVRIDPTSTAVSQLAPGSTLMDALATGDTLFGTRVLALNVPNDPIVPADRAVFPGKQTVTVPPTGWYGGHSAIVRSPFALRSAYNFLRGGAIECPNNWGGVATQVGWITGVFERSLPHLFDLAPALGGTR